MAMNPSAAELEPRVSLLRDDDAWRDERLRTTWRALWAQSPGATLFQTWDWQYNHWRYLTRRARTFLLTVGEPEPVLMGVFYQVRDKRSGLPKVAFVGDDQADNHLLLVQPGVPESVGARAIGEFLKQRLVRVPLVAFTNVPESSWTGRVLQLVRSDRNARFSELVTTEAFAISLPQTPEEYLAGLGKWTRHHARDDLRRLQQQHDLKFAVYTDAGEQCLSAIESVDRARWGDGSNYWRSAMRDFERSCMRGLASSGSFLSIVLWLDNKPAAFVFGGVSGSTWLLLRTGYNPNIAPKLSIGKVTFLYAIQHAIRQGLRECDLSRGGEAYKQWLGGVARTNLQFLVYRSSFDRWLSQALASLMESARSNSFLRASYLRLRKEDANR
ncbi:MAG TPA: GNAT family N-acetyltransferase [bacterium]|nr:GNAT family N-acetyltransferase [bacterium]